MLINARQLAQELGVSTRTLYSLMNSGQLPAGMKIGKSRRWDSDKLKQWLDGLENKGGN